MGEPSAASPEKRPVVVDRSHPHASPVNGNVLPEDKRFQKGNKGGPGRPKGAWPRAALARLMAKGRDSDVDEADHELKIGEGARDLAQELLDAALIGDLKKVRALAEIINQVEGKPQEHVDHTGDVASIRLIGFDSPEDAAPAKSPEAAA